MYNNQASRHHGAPVSGQTSPSIQQRVHGKRAGAPRLPLNAIALACAAALGTPVAIAQTAEAGSAQGEQILPALTVTARLDNNPVSLQQEGKAADGYRSRTVSSVGALGSKALLDTPYSLSVVPHELIQNIQAQSPDDIYKLNASTRSIAAQGTGWAPVVSIRGFNTYDSAEDGLRRSYNYAGVVEDKERIEVLNGLAGFMYGAAAPAGMINYVYKRPTAERLNSVTVGNYGGGQYYVHGDFGGPIDEAGRIGYRLNVVKQDGETAIDDQKIDRELVSAALDWHVTDQLLLELNAVYNSYKTDSPSAYWFYAVPHGPVPDAEKNWSQPWIHDAFEAKKLGAKLSYRLSGNITLRAGFTRNLVDRPVQDHTMNYVTAAGSYRQLRQRAGETKTTDNAGQAMADFSFATGALAHKLTLGYYMYATKSWSTTYSPNTGYLGPYPLTSPTHVAEAVFPANTTSPYYAGKTKNENFLIGDEVKFNHRWSALVGINHSQISTRSVNAAGVKSQVDYDKSRDSPSASLLFKPVPALTVYATYVEGLEMGGRAPATASNKGDIMSPMVSKQKELGVKAEVGAILLTSAIFDIEKAYEFLDGNVYTQNGRQNHKGWEFNVTGKPLSKLTLVGGLTVLDTGIKGGAFNGKNPINVARQVAKIYSEVELPLPGLRLTGGLYYTGKQWANTVNTDRLPAYTTADLGVRYTTSAMNRPVTLRLNVNNVADKNYWADSYYVGAPRTVAFSAQAQF